MNFKLFWRKTNRGLWLGAVLLFALVVFIVVSEVRYNLQKQEIRETAKQFAGELLSVNLAKGELGEDGYLTDAQKAAQRETLERIAGEYWYTGSTELNSKNYDLARLSELLEQWQRDVPGKVEKISYQNENWEVAIQRDGPGRVLVALTADQIEVQGSGAAPKEGQEDGILFPTPVGGRLPGAENAEPEWNRSCTVYFSFEMIRRGGKWQIAGMNANVGNGYYYNYGLLGMLG